MKKTEEATSSPLLAFSISNGPESVPKSTPITNELSGMWAKLYN
jgi:hypothetical protein